MTNNSGLSPITLDDVLECLDRSGYLLESKLVSGLTDKGYFVEPNQVIRDPRTGKSREIDLVAEYYNFQPTMSGVCVKTIFAVEAINNRFPFVLLTQRPSTPNENFESHIKFICTPEPNEFEKHFDLYEERGPERTHLFSQYCALSQKKGDKKEFMASHPDDLYGSFQKLAEYIEDDANMWNKRDDVANDKYWRIFFWHPMLVLGGQLVVITTREDGTTALHYANNGFLEFNWHAGEERRTTVIEVVTADAFFERLSSIVAIDARLHEKLHGLRKQRVPVENGI
jgi:hypothetical protein